MSKKIATREAYGEALADLGGENPDIVVLAADLSKSTKTVDFAKKYPERFFNIGIAEQNLMGVAAGLAAAGKVPFASTFAIFATGRAFDQVRNAICYPKLNVKIAATHAGLTVGEDGASHQSVEDMAIMRAIPNMTVIVPVDAVETKQAVRAAAETNGPVYIRLGRLGVPIIYDEDYRFRLGKASTLRRGANVAIIAAGAMVQEAMAAAEELAVEGIQTEVLNMATIKPLDVDAVVAAAQKCGAVVTAEEHNILGGLGGAVAEILSENFPVPMTRVGVRDTFGESGTPAELLEKYGLTGKHICRAAREVVKRKGGSGQWAG